MCTEREREELKSRALSFVSANSNLGISEFRLLMRLIDTGAATDDCRCVVDELLDEGFLFRDSMNYLTPSA